MTVPYYAISPDNPGEVVILGKVQAKPDAKLPPEQHSVILHDTYNGQRVTLENYSKQITVENSTFDETMYIPTYEEQAELMVGSFPKEALDFAWRDHPEYLRFLRRGTTTVEAPRAVFQQSEPPASAPAAYSASTPAPAAQQLQGEIDPEAAAAYSQLQAAMGQSQAANPPAAPDNVADVVAQARAKAQQQVGAKA